VPVAIEDITPDFLAYWDRAARLDLAEQRRLWLETYELPHREVFDVYYRRHADPGELDVAFARFPDVVPRLRADLPTFRSGIDRLAPIPAISSRPRTSICAGC
jgi:hypothetical protein